MCGLIVNVDLHCHNELGVLMVLFAVFSALTKATSLCFQSLNGEFEHCYLILNIVRDMI